LCTSSSLLPTIYGFAETAAPLIIFEGIFRHGGIILEIPQTPPTTGFFLTRYYYCSHLDSSQLLDGTLNLGFGIDVVWQDETIYMKAGFGERAEAHD
jgi:hypothetical protein